MLNVNELCGFGGMNLGPIRFIGLTETQNTADGTTLAINKPANTNTNDLMIAIVGNGSNAASTWTGDTDWVERADLNEGTGLRIATKVVTSSEPASYTFTCSSSQRLGGVILLYRGAEFEQIGAFSALATGGSAVTAPSVTTIAADCTVIIPFFQKSDSVTWPDISGWTEIPGAVNSDADAPSWRIFSKTFQVPAATGDQTSDPSGSSGEGAAIQIVLKPA